MPVPIAYTRVIDLILDQDILDKFNQVFMFNLDKFEFNSVLNPYLTYRVKVHFDEENLELGELLNGQSRKGTFGQLMYPNHPAMAKHIDLGMLSDFIVYTNRVFNRTRLIDPQRRLWDIDFDIRRNITRNCPTRGCDYHELIRDDDGIDPIARVSMDIEERAQAQADYARDPGRYRQ